MTDLEKVLNAINGRFDNIDRRLDSIDYRLSSLEKDMKEVKNDTASLKDDMKEVKEVQQIHSRYLFAMYNDIKDLKSYNRRQDFRVSSLNADTFEDCESIKVELDNLKFRVERLEQKKAE